VILDDWGNLYLTDTYNGSIRKLTQRRDGQWLVSTVYSGSLQGPNGPTGVAVDSLGALYISFRFQQSIYIGQAGPVPLSAEFAYPDLLLSWPIWGSDFILEAAAELEGTRWTPLPDESSAQLDRLVQAIHPTAAQVFYRLRRVGH
jgi:hypothetical protein